MKKIARLVHGILLGLLAGGAPAQTQTTATQTGSEATSATLSGPDGEAWGKVLAMRDEPITTQEMALIRIPEVVAAAEAFEKQYPESPLAAEAFELMIEAASVLESLDENSKEAARVFKALEERANLPAKPALLLTSRKLHPHVALIQDSATSAAASAMIEKEAAAYEQKYPDTEEAGALWLMIAQLHTDLGDAPRADAIYRRMVSSKAPRIRERAEAVMRRLNLMGSEPELKFTATDGKKIDLADYKGKVVLIDFWATWCAPCVAALPEVKGAYEKFHAQGFEIIGISLDEDRKRFDGFVATRELPWPQYYDGKKWENDIARYYDVTSIPHTWLIDKSGKVVSTETRGTLETDVERLLKE